MKFFLILALVMVAQMVIATAANAANPIVVMKTSMGTVKIELFEEKAATRGKEQQASRSRAAAPKSKAATKPVRKAKSGKR